MSGSMPNAVEEFKIKASILLKNLRSNDSEKAADAANRFQRLPHLTDLSAEGIVQQRDEIKLKHALTVIALENKQPSWPELKRIAEKREELRDRLNYTALYPKRCAGFLNDWCGSYEVALSHRAQNGGYLLPFKSQFFVCTAGYIQALGLAPDDPDWERIGWDWVKPADPEAWERLNQKLKSIESAGPK